MNLILFSGGVESTALLTKAKKDDIALVILPTFDNDLATYRKGTTEKLAEYFGTQVIYGKVSITDNGPMTFVHQMSSFISICNLMAAKNPAIKEIWCGRNSSEPSEHIRKYINQQMLAWSILHPDVAFLHPLDHMTKKEQLRLIPAEIRGLVSSCAYHSYCGKCPKCKEWLCI